MECGPVSTVTESFLTVSYVLSASRGETVTLTGLFQRLSQLLAKTNTQFEQGARSNLARALLLGARARARVATGWRELTRALGRRRL